MQSAPRPFLSVHLNSNKENPSLLESSHLKVPAPPSFLPFVVHSPSSNIAFQKQVPAYANKPNVSALDESSRLSTKEGGSMERTKVHAETGKFNEKSLQVAYAGWKYVKTVEHRLDLQEQVKALCHVLESACFDLNHLWTGAKPSAAQKKCSFISSQIEFAMLKLCQGFAGLEYELSQTLRNCDRQVQKKRYYKIKLREAINEKRRYRNLLEKGRNEKAQEKQWLHSSRCLSVDCMKCEQPATSPKSPQKVSLD